MPTQIKESMVLWYDLKRQGATNENMAENPVLRDLSGNGHDATCYNFAWLGMSGVDGYLLIIGSRVVDDKNIKYVQTNGRCNITYIGESQKNVNIYGNFYQNNYTDTFVIKNIPNGATINFKANTGYHLQVTQEGIYTIDVTDSTLTIAVDNFVGECNIIIEELGLYPHALVSDGVDDYAIANKPVLDDYTLIVKRQIPQTRSNFGVVASTRHVYVEETRMSFSFEAIYPDNNNTCAVMNYLLSGQTVSLDLTNYISYMTSESYNGQNINKNSNLIDSDYIYLFCGGKSSAFIGEFLQAALYSVILFNRTLTPEEIEWVKRNLV